MNSVDELNSLRVRPMLSTSAVSAILDRDEVELQELIDDGSLEWCFNLASGAASKRCVRVLTACVFDFARCRVVRRTFDDVAKLIITHTRPKVRYSEFYRALNVSPRHAIELVHEGAFGEVPIVKGFSPMVDREAALAFLRNRRMGGGF